MEEPQSAQNGVAPSTTTIANIGVNTKHLTHTQTDEAAIEGFSWAQKGLFFAVVVGVVAAYLRMNRQKSKRYPEKSMA